MAELTVDSIELARRSFQEIERPGSQHPASLIHAEYRNWEADGAAAELRGLEAFDASVNALNASFSKLRFEILDTATATDLVALRTVMSGVHTGPMRALPATGKPFKQNQSHWYRIADGLLLEHWATRDDLGFLHQIGAAPGSRVGSKPTN